MEIIRSLKLSPFDSEIKQLNNRDLKMGPLR